MNFKAEECIGRCQIAAIVASYLVAAKSATEDEEYSAAALQKKQLLSCK